MEARGGSPVTLIRGFTLTSARGANGQMCARRWVRSVVTSTRLCSQSAEMINWWQKWGGGDKGSALRVHLQEERFIPRGRRDVQRVIL